MLARLSLVLFLLGGTGPAFARRTVLVLCAVLSLLAGAQDGRERDLQPAALCSQPLTPARWNETEGVARLRISGWSRALDRDRWQAPAVLQRWIGPRTEADRGTLWPAPGQGVYLTGKGISPGPGSTLTGILRLRVPARGDLPGSFSMRRYLRGRHLMWQGRLQEFCLDQDRGFQEAIFRILVGVRLRLLDGLANLLPPGEAQLAGAVLLGARTRESSQMARPFSRLGLAHLFAVSGLHVGVLTGLLLLPLQLSGAPPRFAVGAMTLLLPTYALLTGLPDSVVRAVGLSLLALGTRAWGRQGAGLHLLGLLFCLTTFWEPRQLGDVGFRLSYLAAGGIMLMTRLVKVEEDGNPAWRMLRQGLVVSLAALWFTLLPVASSFGRLTPVAPLANVLAVPLFGLGVWFLVPALCLLPLWPWGAQALAAWVWLLWRGLGGGASLAAGWVRSLELGFLPPEGLTALLWLGSTLAGLGFLGWRRLQGLSPRPGILLLVVLLVLVPGFFHLQSGQEGHPATPVVWQFAVDQGDCGLIIFPDGWRCLIDLGGRAGFTGGAADGSLLERRVLPFLQRTGVAKVDAVILTHGHDDHTGGSAAAARLLLTGEWLGGGDSAADLAARLPDIPIGRVSQPRTLHRWQQWRLEVRSPEGQRSGLKLHENDRSLLTTLYRNEHPVMVWTGDLEQEGEKLALADGFPEGPVQVWKAGHHGSDTSGSGAWVDHLAPRLVLISCGVANRYRHPSHGPYLVRGDTLDYLRTDLDGSIRLQWDASGGVSWRTRDRGGCLPPLTAKTATSPACLDTPGRRT